MLLTSLVDHVRFPAPEVAALYASRWEVEIAFDDMKTEQLRAATTLRSKQPDGVYQEVYGLLVAHNLVRAEMARSAVLFSVAPTRINFHRSLELVQEQLRSMCLTTAPSKLGGEEFLLRERLRFLVLPERRSHRRYPRALKVVVPKYPRKVPRQPEGSA